MKNILSVLLTVIMVLSLFIITSSTVAGAGGTGTAVLAVEAFTVDGGFILLPVEVSINGTSNIISLLRSELTAENVNFNTGAGKQIINIAVSHSGTLRINNKDIQDALNGNYGSSTAYSGWLSEKDFTTNSSWLVIKNNSVEPLGAEYIPAAGDVIRVAFSVTGTGSDLAIGGVGSTRAIFSESVSRDNLYKKMAEEYDAHSDITPDLYVINRAVNLNSTQENLNEAIAFMDEDWEVPDPLDGFGNDIISTATYPVVTTPSPTGTAPSDIVTTRPSTVTTPSATNSVDVIPNKPTAPTGVGLFGTVPLIAVLGGLMLVSRRRKK